MALVVDDLCCAVPFSHLPMETVAGGMAQTGGTRQRQWSLLT